MDAKRAEIGARLKAARERRGYTQRALAAVAEVPQAAISRLEGGQSTRTPLVQLDRLASALGVTMTSLLAESPVQRRAQLAARTPEGADNTAAKAYALSLLEFDNDLDAVVPDVLLPTPVIPPVEVPAGDVSSAQGKELARRVRETLGLGVAPLTDLPELLEQLTGADVATAPLEGASGVCAVDPERRMRLVVTSSTEPAERQRFSLAHELGHMLFGDERHVDQVAGVRDPREVRSDEFARNLLVPIGGVKAWLDRCLGEVRKDLVTERVIALLCRHFGVSPRAMSIQLDRMGLLSVQRAALPTGREFAHRYGWPGQYEGEQRAAQVARPPRRVLERAYRAYQEGMLGVEALARLEGRPTAEVDRELAAAGVVVSRRERPSSLEALLARREAKW